jgi:hypothetical protein
MKTNSFKGKDSHHKVNIILGQLTSRTINKIARSQGYIQRKSFLICPKSFIMGFMLMVSKQRNTYTDWATEIGLIEGRSFSKQALNERMRPQTEKFVKQVVEQTISNQAIKHNPKTNGVLKHFGNVMIDDSTTLSLPDALVGTYPGNVSKGIKKAQAKIHAMYNMTENNFAFLSVHSFSNNDQSLSHNVIPYLKEGDLCLRDLGFTILEVISQFVDNGIYFIARKGYNTSVYDVNTKKKISLLKELRKKNFIDKPVLIGKKEKIKLRLIAIAIPDEQAAERRRKAKADRDRRLNHCVEYYEMLGYSIYLTNISTSQCNSQEISQLYKLRWRIEIIFKSWKSYFSIEKIIHRQCTNAIRVKCIIYLMLLYIYLFQVVWWKYYEDEIKKGSVQVELSILKLANFFKNHFTQIITSKSDKQIITQILTHCCYDKRWDRLNAKQFQLKLAA